MTFKNTKILLLDFKDFFRVSNNIQHSDQAELSYRKTVITEDSLLKQNSSNLVSFEKISANKLIGIFSYLKYKIRQNKNGDICFNPEELKWYSKNARFFNNLLNNIDKKTSFLTPEYIFIQNKYECKKYNDVSTVGRLYCNKSIQTLPREIRYHLFKSSYIDLDIENAHPTILYLYSKNKNLVLTGALRNYIENKEDVIQKIKIEKRLRAKELSSSQVKRLVLQIANRTWVKKPDVSSTLENLDKDFSLIRNSLWCDYENGLMSDFSNPLDKNEGISIRTLKVKLQCFYCQTQETTHVLKLVNFLRLYYDEYLTKSNKKFFTDYYPYTDKTIKLSSKHTLLTIPFFDGIYVSTPEQEFNNNLKNIIKFYNSNNIVKFKEKNIEPNRSQIQDYDEFRKFLIITSWFSQLNNMKILQILLDVTGVLQTLEDVTLDIESYGDRINSVRDSLFSYLLKLDFNNENDITNIVKTLKIKL